MSQFDPDAPMPLPEDEGLTEQQEDVGDTTDVQVVDETVVQVEATPVTLALQRLGESIRDFFRRLVTNTVDNARQLQEDLDDQDSFSIGILDTRHANVVHVLVDDTNGGAPSQYTITFFAWNKESQRFMQHSEFTGRTDRSWRFGEPTERWKAEITNTSGATDDFEAYAEAKRE